MTRRIRGLALYLFVLLGCGGSPPRAATSSPTPTQAAATDADPSATQDSRAPTESEAHAIGELERAAEQVRGLRFLSPVPVLVKNRDAITGYVESQIEEDAINRGRALYVALGLLPADLDVRAQLLQLLGEQILGYYDAEQKHLVVRDDVMRALGKQIGQSQALEEARLVLVHELVHALQDQHLKLSLNIERERASDAENAFRSLIEGDATLAMLGYMFESSGVPLRQITSDPSRLRSLPGAEGEDAIHGGQQLASAPAILRVPLLSAYRDGLGFCAYAHSRGGWTAVDMAHDNLPASTEHVLHPEKWSSGEQPDAIEIGTLQALEQAGYAALETTTLGELETSIYFEQGQPPAAARKSAVGWGGDQVRVYRGAAGDTPVVWFTSWDDRREAIEAEAAAHAVQRALGNRPTHKVQRVGRAVLILRHFPESLVASVVQHFTTWANRLPPTPPTSRAGR